MNHTPGPWEALLAIAERIDGTPYDVLSNGPDILTSLNCWLMDHEDIDPQQADAAPELLEALEEAGKFVVKYDWLDPDGEELIIKISDAIAKARGEDNAQNHTD